MLKAEIILNQNRFGMAVLKMIGWSDLNWAIFMKKQSLVSSIAGRTRLKVAWH